MKGRGCCHTSDRVEIWKEFNLRVGSAIAREKEERQKIE